MSLPGVVVNVLDGNLNIQPGSTEQMMLYMGCALGGTPQSLTIYGDSQTMTSALVGGELLEAAAYELAVSGGPVMVMPMTPTTRGGVGSVTKVGTGAGTMSVSIAPHVAITITCTTSGALGTAAFTFQLGSGAVSAPVVSASSWSSTGYLVPGTYCTVVFTAGSYVGSGTVDTYVISTLGVVTHPTGAGPTVPTFTASPVDYYYTPLITISTGGALGTMQFTYSLDGTSGSTSSAIVSPGGGVYAIPGTGLVLTFASTFAAGDTYTFNAAGPTSNNTELTTSLTALQTTYLSRAVYSMVSVLSSTASASAWSTQCATCETSALALFNSGVYVRFFCGCPTVGTVLPNAGSITVDSADTDSTVISARVALSAPHVVPCAGDCSLTSAVSGISFRRNALWPASARAASVEASESVGAVADGGLASVTALYRDESSVQGFDAAGITSLRTFPGAGANGFFVTNAYTASVSTSDYYALTNARVIDLACRIARLNALPLVLSKIPTTTGGVITEKKAQQIEAKLNAALETSLVDTEPQDAVAASVVVNRTHNILADGNLIIAVSVQPFGYAKTVTVNIGLAVTA